MNSNSYINLLVKDVHTVFCFFQISEQWKNEYIELNGSQFINEAVPFIKVFYLENGISDFKYILYPDRLANNWYLNIEDEDQDLYVVLGLVHVKTIIEIATSNVITTSREHPSMDMELYYVKIDCACAEPRRSITNFENFESPKIFKGHVFHRNRSLEEKIHNIEKKKLNSSI